MARAKSAEKREAILRSAAREIAAVGLGASTAKIAAGAELAEGTLFTYFSTKDALFNELYVELKMDAYRRLHDGFPLEGSLRDRAEHIWTAYLGWAMEKPQDREVSVLLNLCSQVTAETRKQLETVHGPIQTTVDELSKVGAFASLPKSFAVSSMIAMQEAVLETAAKHPRGKAKLIAQAFAAFWRLAE